MKEYAYFICDATQEEYNIIQQYQPSLIAAACVYLARRCCHFEKVWTKDMEGYTQHKGMSSICIDLFI